MTSDHVYGPVPSRRLGRSLGVDLVPYKVCTYDCIYCQLGRTSHKTVTRSEYVPLDDLLAEIDAKLTSGPRPDYLTLAGSGEPTLHCRIADIITAIHGLTRIPVAVLTNGSLLWMPEVRESLMQADLVIPSLDAGSEKLFHQVNRPHDSIDFGTMVQGLADFTRCYAGPVWLEVLLLDGITAIPAETDAIAALARTINPARIQIHTAYRPPAESSAIAVTEARLVDLGKRFSGTVDIIGGQVPRSQCDEDGNDVSTREAIMVLLKRRPCTAADIADGLGIRLVEIHKHLDILCETGHVHTTISNDRRYFVCAEATR